MIKTQVDLADPIPVPSVLKNQGASGLVQAVYDVIASHVGSTIPHKNTIIDAVKAAIDVLPKVQVNRDNAINLAVANNGAYAGLAALIKTQVDLVYPIKDIKDYKFTAKAFTAPKEASYPALIPPAPSCAEFTAFVNRFYPNHLVKYTVHSGAQPQTVVARLCKALDSAKVGGLFNQGNFITAQAIYEELNKKLRVAYDSLTKLSDNNKIKDLLDKLLDRSRYCLAGLGGAIEDVYVSTQIGEISISDQINNYLINFKDNALTMYVQATHPASITDLIMNDFGRSKEQFPHIKNTYLKTLGDDLGFRKESIDAIKSDPHIDPVLEASINLNKAQIISDIKTNIGLAEVIMGGAIKGLMDDINHGSMNYKVDSVFNTITPNTVVLPYESSYVDGKKLGFWVQYVEYGGDLDGVSYDEIEDFTERFEFSNLSQADQDMISNRYNFNNLPTAPHDVKKESKKAMLLTPETTLWLLEIEGFIERK